MQRLGHRIFSPPRVETRYASQLAIRKRDLRKALQLSASRERLLSSHLPRTGETQNVRTRVIRGTSVICRYVRVNRKYLELRLVYE